MRHSLWEKLLLLREALQLPVMGALIRVVEKGEGDPQSEGTLFLVSQVLSTSIFMLDVVSPSTITDGAVEWWVDTHKDHAAWRPEDRIQLLLELKTNDPTEEDNGWWGTLFVNGDLPKTPHGRDLKLQEKVEFFVVQSSL